MRDLEQCNGPWAGRWVQFSICGAMSLTMRIARGRMDALGSDPNGDFTFDGGYTGADVLLTKIYAPGTYGVPSSITYQGTWNGSFIAGFWVDDEDDWNAGDFELWPLDEELNIETLSQERELQNT